MQVVYRASGCLPYSTLYTLSKAGHDKKPPPPQKKRGKPKDPRVLSLLPDIVRPGVVVPLSKLLYTI